MVSPYLPHALYSIALCSISIHIVNHKRTSEEDRTRLQARTSILQQIQDHLRSPKPVPWDEVERLKRLARPVKVSPDGERFLPEVQLEWRDVFYGRKLPKDDGEDGMSEWDRKDLEKLKSAFASEGKS